VLQALGNTANALPALALLAIYAINTHYLIVSHRFP
jgi:hypothetical protein